MTDDYVHLFKRKATDLLARHPGLAHKWEGDAHLHFPRSTDSGFSVDIFAEAMGCVVSFVGAHEHFGPLGGNLDDSAEKVVDQALAFATDLLGTGARIREKRAGGSAYKWIVEIRQPEGWKREITSGSLVFNYFGKRHERVYQNTHLPSRHGGAG